MPLRGGNRAGARVVIIPVDRNLNHTHIMSMQASTLGILEAADFSPKQARALAQAIEGEIKGSDIVTRPVFDAGVAELKLQMSEIRIELARLENRMFNKMVGLGMTSIGLTLTGVYFVVLHLKS